ncbi:MAG: 2-hydroxyacyl-CoA dehydratase family protein [Clostridiales bacterium]|nr:2-hydroxyacyl-CoA dehydratase family protein [Clostridiales bacterium]
MADTNTSKSVVKKALQATKTASVYQKEWFQGLRKRVDQGDDFALVTAEVPMEILRAMDIPFVVNQWWASICAAKRMTPRYNDFLNQAGYRSDICSYCATAFAESLDPQDEEIGPWGGLPKPTLAITRLSCDYQAKIFQLFAQNHGAALYTMETTVARKTPLKWWEIAQDQWEDMYDAERLDMGVKELQQMIFFLEEKTGRMFDINRLEEVMLLINEQEGWYRKTRDLIAHTVPAPVTVVDTVNAVMQGQWQRGTRWGADHAKSLYEEVKGMADQKKAAVPNERYRLMWLGRGLWHDFAFYQNFEEKYGAVFVWTMYLGMAADAYIRNHVSEDPLRALAARFVGLEDFLHMPPWNAQWFLKEAINNQIDGVVYMVPDSCAISLEGSYFIRKALEDAGIPVLVFKADPVNPGNWSRDTMTAMVENFIENRVMKQKEER